MSNFFAEYKNIVIKVPLIKEGLKPGEKVIYEGLQQVREGQVVNPEIVDIKIPDLESI